MLLLHAETNNAFELPISQQPVAITAAVIIAALQLTLCSSCVVWCLAADAVTMAALHPPPSLDWRSVYAESTPNTPPHHHPDTR
jgi:hypothetical protein